jgi:hypothetical protein
LSTALHILAKTPPWAFLVLAYLVWQGLESLRARTQPFWRLLLVPTFFIAFGVSRTVGGSTTQFSALLPWAIGLVICAPVAFITGPRLLAVDRRRGLVSRPGSPVPLIRNVGVFALQYTLAVMTGGSMAGSANANLVAHGIAGCTAGYFAGWVIVALRHYLRAPEWPSVARPPS